MKQERHIIVEQFRHGDQERFREVRRIRHEVFIIGQRVPEELEYEFEEEAIHYLVKVDGMAVGTARWRETPKGIKLERFAVLEAERGKGTGTRLLERVMEEVLPMKKRIYLHAQVTAMNYYLRAGFVVIGEPFYEAGIEHYLMEYPGLPG
ncbi:MAG: GNAT family N-acetyltransferase [Bacteroidales bacterium]